MVIGHDVAGAIPDKSCSALRPIGFATPKPKIIAARPPHDLNHGRRNMLKYIDGQTLEFRQITARLDRSWDCGSIKQVLYIWLCRDDTEQEHYRQESQADKPALHFQPP